MKHGNLETDMWAGSNQFQEHLEVLLAELLRTSIQNL